MKLPRVGRGAVADCELVWLRFDFVANVFEIPRAARAMNWAPAPRPGVVCRTFATLATLRLWLRTFASLRQQPLRRCFFQFAHPERARVGVGRSARGRGGMPVRWCRHRHSCPRGQGCFLLGVPPLICQSATHVPFMSADVLLNYSFAFALSFWAMLGPRFR